MTMTTTNTKDGFILSREIARLTTMDAVIVAAMSDEQLFVVLGELKAKMAALPLDDGIAEDGHPSQSRAFIKRLAHNCDIQEIHAELKRRVYFD